MIALTFSPVLPVSLSLYLRELRIASCPTPAPSASRIGAGSQNVWGQVFKHCFLSQESNKCCLVGSYALQKANRTHKRSSIFFSCDTVCFPQLSQFQFMGGSSQTQGCIDTHTHTPNSQMSFLSDPCFLDSQFIVAVKRR